MLPTETQRERHSRELILTKPVTSDVTKGGGWWEWSVLGTHNEEGTLSVKNLRAIVKLRVSLPLTTIMHR